MGDFQASKPALQSKINRVAVAIPIVAAAFVVFLPEHKDIINQTALYAQSVITVILRTWFTNTSISGAI